MYLNNQQSFAFGFIILGLLSFIACEKTIETSKLAAFGVKTDLKQAESIWFGADTLTGLQVTVKDINDSRCPNDPTVQCVWGGEANVKLLVSADNDSTSIDVKLAPTNNYKTDTVSFKLKNNNYKAVLFDVSPYPNNKNQGSKFATLTILNSN